MCNSCGMTTAYETPDYLKKREVPEFDLADRMRKALRHADVGVGEMAGYLEVSRETVSSWINGRGKPSPQSIYLFAMRTGVDRDWLRRGAPTGDGELLPRLDSNQQPFDLLSFVRNRRKSNRRIVDRRAA